jgi:hypothetical protein
VEIGAMQLDDDDREIIMIGAIEVEQLLLEAKEQMKEKALLDEGYLGICRQLSSGGNVDNHYGIQDKLLCWKNRIYVPQGLRTRSMSSKHDSKITGHFGRERRMKLLTQNFYLPNMEIEVHKYCNECNNCQRTKAP